MSKKKNKFDLTSLVHQGVLKEGQTLFYVSDPTKTCKITKQPNGEFKVAVKVSPTGERANETITVHAFAQQCLGQEPPEHAARWLRTENGKTLYEIWHADDDYAHAA